MNLWLECLQQHRWIFDSLGIVGIGILALASARLATRYQSWGGTMMTIGAISLLLARLYVLLSPHFLTNDVLSQIGALAMAATIGLPPILFTGGLAGIVWGLWCHERWLRESR